MSGAIARAREVLGDPDAPLSEKLHMVGLLAIAVVAGGGSEADTEEARRTVLAFWRETAVAS